MFNSIFEHNFYTFQCNFTIRKYGNQEILKIVSKTRELSKKLNTNRDKDPPMRPPRGRGNQLSFLMANFNTYTCKYINYF